MEQRRLRQHDGFEITELPLRLPRLAPEFKGYRIAQISDIHMGRWTNRTRLNAVVDEVNRLKPDLIAVTGDFITKHPEKYAPELAASLKRLAAPDGVLAVMGNHDHWGGLEAVRQILYDSGLCELKNCFITLSRGPAQLIIAGVDDTYVHADRLDQVLEKMPPEGAAILLAHEPDYADVSAAAGRFDLQLSGHSHGGQVVLPLIGPPYLPQHCKKYIRGLYNIHGMLLYTNRGLGTVHLPFRINSKPEISLFILQSGIIRPENG